MHYDEKWQEIRPKRFTTLKQTSIQVNANKREKDAGYVVPYVLQGPF